MMKTRILILTILATLFMVACNDDEVDSLVSKKEETNLDKKPLEVGFILKERDSNSPLILSKRRENNQRVKTRNQDEPFYSFLGRSLKAYELPLTYYKNFGWKVIDMDSFLRDYPNCYEHDLIGTSDERYFSYSNFNRYIEKSEVTKKVRGGFSLNLGVFKIGAKHSMTKIFKSEIINEKNRIFGEVHYYYLGSRYWLKNSSRDIKLMKSYLSQSFIDDLYNIPPAEFFDIYGSFVMCDFIVGGKATALYTGLHKESGGNEIKEKNMETDIEASYGKKDSINGSINFGFGKDYNNGNAFSHKITDLKVSIKTLGGIGAIGSYTNPQNVNSVNINLSSWLNSLNNVHTQSIIEISDNGLWHISEFIREDNLKRHIMTPNGQTKLKEPSLVWAYFEELNLDIILLKTRYEDAILLAKKEHTTINDVENLINQYHSLYKLKTDAYPHISEVSPYSISNPNNISEVQKYIRDTFNNKIGWYPIDKPIGTEMKKFICDNVIYLVSQKLDQKLAFSIHDDYILDTYAFRDWVNNMQTIQLSIEELDDYTIIAL